MIKTDLDLKVLSFTIFANLCLSAKWISIQLADGIRSRAVNTEGARGVDAPKIQDNIFKKVDPRPSFLMHTLVYRIDVQYKINVQVGKFSKNIKRAGQNRRVGRKIFWKINNRAGGN